MTRPWSSAGAATRGARGVVSTLSSSLASLDCEDSVIIRAVSLYFPRLCLDDARRPATAPTTFRARIVAYPGKQSLPWWNGDQHRVRANARWRRLVRPPAMIARAARIEQRQQRGAQARRSRDQRNGPAKAGNGFDERDQHQAKHGCRHRRAAGRMAPVEQAVADEEAQRGSADEPGDPQAGDDQQRDGDAEAGENEHDGERPAYHGRQRARHHALREVTPSDGAHTAKLLREERDEQSPDAGPEQHAEPRERVVVAEAEPLLGAEIGLRQVTLDPPTDMAAGGAHDLAAKRMDVALHPPLALD